MQHNTNSNFAKIDLSNFSKGIYFVEVQTEVGETIRRKVLKAE
ncbi:MAG: T9SS type A sorting domain-containing protein [Bacteroidia bacterium]